MRKLNNDDGTKPRNESSAESADTRKRPHGEEVADAGRDTRNDHDEEQARLEREVREAAEQLTRVGTGDVSRRDQEVEDEETEQRPRFILAPPTPPRMDIFPEVQRLLDEVTIQFLVSPNIPAASLIGLLACLVGNTRRLNMGTRKELGNLWIIIIAESGMGKSPVMRFFFRGVLKIDSALYKRWQKERREYIAAEKTGKKNLEMPKKQQLRVNDATLEAVSKRLEGNPRGLMWYGDEISAILASFDKYKKNNQEGETKGRLLSAFDGDAWSVDRVDDDRTQHMDAACLSIFGGIQPGRMKKAFDTSDDPESGFLPRFCLVRADMEWFDKYRRTPVSPESLHVLERIVDGLWRFSMIQGEEGPTPVDVQVTETAEAAYEEWYEGLSRKTSILYQAGGALSWDAKLKAICLRLALLFHCLKAVLEGKDGTAPLEEPTMRLATRFADWFRSNQNQVLEILREGQQPKALRPLDCHLAAELVAEAGRRGGFPFEVTSSQFEKRLSEKMGMPISPTAIGKAMSRLGFAKSALRSRGGNVERVRLITEKELRPFIQVDQGA